MLSASSVGNEEGENRKARERISAVILGRGMVMILPVVIAAEVGRSE